MKRIQADPKTGNETMTIEQYTTEPTPPGVEYTSTASGVLNIRLSGNWTLNESIPASEEIFRKISHAKTVHDIKFETSALGAWDTVFLTLIKDIIDYCRDNRLKVDQKGLPEGVRGLLNLADTVPERSKEDLSTVEKESILEEIGRDTVEFLHQSGILVTFIGKVFLTVGRFLIGKARVRRTELVFNIQEAGVRGVPIVSLLTFLVGVILAYVAAAQLTKFGAKILVANLVGVAMAREMAPMITAVIMAGRTGGAYAAQLGTMTVNEEIDAFRTLGLPPMEMLVLPRVLALTLMMPFLVVYANLMGNLGGAVVAIFRLDIGATEYFTALSQAITWRDFLEGLIKSFVYGWLVAISGCLKGIYSGRSAGAVGTSTTSAVVMSLVLIVSSSAVLTAFFDTLWGM